MQDIVLLYAGTGLPILLGITDRPGPLGRRLREVIPLLPERFYAHLTPGVEEVFRQTHRPLRRIHGGANDISIP